MSRKSKRQGTTTPAASRAPVSSAVVAAPTTANTRPFQSADGFGLWLPGLVLMAVTLIAYWPALHGGFLWDDDAHISANDALRTARGLWEIWFKPGATCQYYPLTFSVFWLEYHGWQLHTLGYHLVNVLLHGTVAVLLWQVLHRLKVRGAWLAGGIFALHPVCVMSVAWMTELKNTLSATLALGAAWAYLRAAGLGVYGKEGRAPRLDPRFYVLSLALFQLALFAKTAVSFLPVTLLLVAWWCGRKLNWRTVWPVLPMFAIAVGMGLFTVFMEQHLEGATEARFQVPFINRVLISGRSFWFYLGKLLFPRHLSFIYERWNVDAGVAWQLVFPAATAGALLGAWWLRNRIGRGLLVVLLHFYVSTSLLILMVVLFMTHYTFVADHWQYFGCMSVIAAAAAGISRVLDQLPPARRFLKPAVCCALLLVLAALTWRQCGTYAGPETLWRATLQRSPNSPMAHGCLANFLLLSKRIDEAIPEFQRSLELDPHNTDVRLNLGAALAQANRLDEAMAEDRTVLEARPRDVMAHCNLGSALDQAHRPPEALLEYQRAAELDPDSDLAQTGLGNVLLETGRADDAIAHFKKALEIRPRDAAGHYNLGNLLARRGQAGEAIGELRQAVQLDPGDAMARNNLGSVLYQQGRVEEAIAQFEKTVELLPNEPKVRCNLGLLLIQRGRVKDAAQQFEEAVAIQPDLEVARSSLRGLAWLLATSPDAAKRDGQLALELARKLVGLPGGETPANLAVLAAAQAESGQLGPAAGTAQQALDLAGPQAGPDQIAKLRAQLAAYQAGTAWRDANQINASIPPGSR